MSNLHNVKQYKISKVICTDLQVILKVVDLSIRGLTNFKHYIPVARILNTLNNEKEILEAHLAKYSKINKEKGKVNE